MIVGSVSRVNGMKDFLAKNLSYSGKTSRQTPPTMKKAMIIPERQPLVW